jgi:predicted alpha/beta-hydrolase family hydrolase
MTFEAFSARAGGETPNARLYEAEAGTAPLLILAPGAGAGQSHPFIVRYAAGLAERGLHVATFDFPYMQAGRRAPDRAPVLEDAFRAAVTAAVAQLPGRITRLLIGGKSMGGRIATHLAAAPERWPSSSLPLAGVIVFGYPLRPPAARRTPSRDRTAHLERIAVPVLIVQGTRDPFGGPDVIASAMPQARVHAVAGADHTPGPEHDAEVLDTVRAFVNSLSSL